MKLHKFSLALAATLGGLLAVANVTSAQNTNTNATRRSERRGPMVQQRVERMTTELKLNDDQKAKVTALLEKQAKQRREIFADNSLPREERRDKVRTIMEDENKQLKAILTGEQYETWQKMREKERARRAGGSGGPGKAAPEPKAPESKSE